MRNIKRITTQDELDREIADTKLEIERQKLSVKDNWTSLKNEMRPVNVRHITRGREAEGTPPKRPFI